MDILALASSTARRFGELGFLIATLGALLVMAVGVGPDRGGWRKLLTRLGPLLMAVGFACGIVYAHWV